MNTVLKEFIEKLAKDSVLQEKMTSCKSTEEAYALACESTVGFTQEEFRSAMQDIQNGAADGELKESDLEEVSGGLDTTTWVAIGVGIGAPAAAAAM